MCFFFSKMTKTKNGCFFYFNRSSRLPLGPRVGRLDPSTWCKTNLRCRQLLWVCFTHAQVLQFNQNTLVYFPSNSILLQVFIFMFSFLCPICPVRWPFISSPHFQGRDHIIQFSRVAISPDWPLLPRSGHYYQITTKILPSWIGEI